MLMPESQPSYTVLNVKVVQLELSSKKESIPLSTIQTTQITTISIITQSFVKMSTMHDIQISFK